MVTLCGHSMILIDRRVDVPGPDIVLVSGLVTVAVSGLAEVG